MKRLLDSLKISFRQQVFTRPHLPEDASVLTQLKEFVYFSEFKRILDKIVIYRTENKVKSLALLSERPGEGKTFFAAALATGLSELLHIKILVINTQTFVADDALTLDRALETDELSSQRGGPILKSLLVNTDILPIESLQSGKGITEFRIGDVIKRFSESYDLLVFDTSALSARNRNNIDPWVVARQVDANLLVVGRETLRRQPSSELMERMKGQKLKLAGIVFNEGTNG
jgi:Mrp family chromosome partitioning ATPase